MEYMINHFDDFFVRITVAYEDFQDNTQSQRYCKRANNNANKLQQMQWMQKQDIIFFILVLKYHQYYFQINICFENKQIIY
ncbi:unnamed protein product [Paramecium pentaurelia]|uniref:Uncharacterized protein n=1 Tax=Paramecium pentaurelia TaxID=43138 RepID=A0A8S1YBV8_9CILI|nr:unnamed protein product [Paramecium pentaurelia]